MDHPTDSLPSILDGASRAFDRVLADRRPRLHIREYGTVRSLGQGIARVEGLPGVQAEELVRLSEDSLGMVFNLDPQEVGVVCLDRHPRVQAGTEVVRTGRTLDVPVGETLLGRVVDPLGRPLDEAGPLHTVERRPLEREAPAILDRDPVTVPLQTGLKVIDALIPIGRGQRELILGDRQTGKSTIALDAIMAQADTSVICVYCAVGQRGSAVAKAVAELKRHDALDYSIVVVAEGNDPPGLQYVAPYAATTMAEFFMEAGRDVLIVYDDLTRHAQAYRELSLLLRRPPGREAFPGDIFYIHARLLERATHLRRELGGGSLTALPIIETEAQNISAYIPTNLISITDGQVYLSPLLFQKGILPAVDVGKSVSRVGGKTQRPAYRSVTGDLRLTYAQFEELEAFSRFGTRLDDATRETLERGKRVREVLKQRPGDPIPAVEQIGILLAVNAGLLDPVPLEEISQAEQAIRRALRGLSPTLTARIETGIPFTEEDRREVLSAAAQAVSSLMEQEVHGNP